LHTTNYFQTFIEVAEDCRIDTAEIPSGSEGQQSIAWWHYTLISAEPYCRTSDDVIFETWARRRQLPEPAWEAARVEFFSKGQACLRSSPLGKRYGWGIHSDEQGRVALVARESDLYAVFANDPTIRHTRAMRSKRA